MIFAVIFIGSVLTQIRARKFHPVIYWFAIVASTTVGTTLADFATRSIGIGYTGGTAILLSLVLGSLIFWKRVTGTVSVTDVSSPQSEFFYWLTITFSQTLGTALGDWAADAGLGYAGGALAFGAALAVAAAQPQTARHAKNASSKGAKEPDEKIPHLKRIRASPKT